MADQKISMFVCGGAGPRAASRDGLLSLSLSFSSLSLSLSGLSLSLSPALSGLIHSLSLWFNSLSLWSLSLSLVLSLETDRGQRIAGAVGRHAAPHRATL